MPDLSRRVLWEFVRVSKVFLLGGRVVGAQAQVGTAANFAANSQSGLFIRLV
jgi:hypothetical protein